MSKTIIVCGYGPGISDAVANKFGAEAVAARFWEIYGARTELSVTVG